MLSRHVGAARFAFNQALRLHKGARAQAGSERSSGAVSDGDVVGPGIEDSRDGSGVPWSGFDLINAFNRWKVSAAAGHRFVVAADGTAEVEVTGLVWREQVLAQVFEEGVVDLGRALKACGDSRTGVRKGPRVGFPRFKKKNRAGGSFRIRNKTARGRSSIRVGDSDCPVRTGARSVSLPKIGTLKVREDTRRLRRTSDGVEVLRVANPRAFRRGLKRLRRLSKAVSRKKTGSKNRKKAVLRLSRQHARIRDRRHHYLHQVSNQLVKTHDKLVLEDLNITGMRSNRRLSRAISDAAWGELARQITYKQAWRGGQVVLADRWFPSTKTCSSCGTVRTDLTLKDRTFQCRSCGHVMDRDLNAAVNLAAWAENHTPAADDGAGCGVARVGDRQAAGPVTTAHRQDTPTRSDHRGRSGKGLNDVGTRVQAAPAA